MASLRSEPHRTPARAKGYSRHVDDAHPFTASLPVKGKPSGPSGLIPETATTSAPAMSPSVAGAL